MLKDGKNFRLPMHKVGSHIPQVIIHKGDQPTFEEELAQDVLEIITVFSARLYGLRSKKHRRIKTENGASAGGSRSKKRTRDGESKPRTPKKKVRKEPKYKKAVPSSAERRRSGRNTSSKNYREESDENEDGDEVNGSKRRKRNSDAVSLSSGSSDLSDAEMKD